TLSPRWYFPDVDDRGPYRSSIVLMNPGGAATTVAATFLFADRAPTSTQIALAAGERKVLAYPDIPVPPGIAYSVSLATTGGAGIVAERVSAGTTKSGTWRRSALGAMDTNTRWLFPSIGMTLHEDADLVILNTSDDTARVKIHLADYAYDSPSISEVIVE